MSEYTKVVYHKGKSYQIALIDSLSPIAGRSRYTPVFKRVWTAIVSEEVVNLNRRPGETNWEEQFRTECEYSYDFKKTFADILKAYLVHLEEVNFIRLEAKHDIEFEEWDGIIGNLE